MKVYVLNYYDGEHSGIQDIYFSKTKAELDKLELEQKEFKRQRDDISSYYGNSPKEIKRLNEAAESSVEYWYDIDETEVIE